MIDPNILKYLQLTLRISTSTTAHSVVLKSVELPVRSLEIQFIQMRGACQTACWICGALSVGVVDQKPRTGQVPGSVLSALGSEAGSFLVNVPEAE